MVSIFCRIVASIPLVGEIQKVVFPSLEDPGALEDNAKAGDVVMAMSTLAGKEQHP